jgi:hypothetical protein
MKKKNAPTSVTLLSPGKISCENAQVTCTCKFFTFNSLQGHWPLDMLDREVSVEDFERYEIDELVAFSICPCEQNHYFTLSPNQGSVDYTLKESE